MFITHRTRNKLLTRCGEGVKETDRDPLTLAARDRSDPPYPCTSLQRFSRYASERLLILIALINYRRIHITNMEHFF